MKFRWQKGLPFITAKLTVEGKVIEIHNALVDSGAASSLFSIENFLNAGLTINSHDIIVEMVGIGGTESVFQRKINEIKIANISVGSPIVQFGTMNYGFEIDGIIGSDILSQARAIIDYDQEAVFFKR